MRVLIRERCHVPFEKLTDRSSKRNWNSVTDQAPVRREIWRATAREKLVIPGKALQHRGFSKRNRAILFRMAKTTIPISEALGSDGW